MQLWYNVPVENMATPAQAAYVLRMGMLLCKDTVGDLTLAPDSPENKIPEETTAPRITTAAPATTAPRTTAAPATTAPPWPPAAPATTAVPATTAPRTTAPPVQPTNPSEDWGGSGPILKRKSPLGLFLFATRGRGYSHHG